MIKTLCNQREKFIRADERRKFAYWLKSKIGLYDFYGDELEVDWVISMYEKELKNDSLYDK